MVNDTTTGNVDAPDRLAITPAVPPLSPNRTFDSDRFTVGNGSSLVTVAVPRACVIVPPTAPDRSRKNCSVASNTESLTSVTLTVRVCIADDGAKVSVSPAPTKSGSPGPVPDETAVSFAVA